MGPIEEFYATIPSTEPPQVIDDIYDYLYNDLNRDEKTQPKIHRADAQSLAKIICANYNDVDITEYGEDGFIQTYEELIIPINNTTADNIILLISYVIMVCSIKIYRLRTRSDISYELTTDDGRDLWDSICRTCNDNGYRVIIEGNDTLTTKLDGYLIACIDNGDRHTRRPTLSEAIFYFSGHATGCGRNV